MPETIQKLLRLRKLEYYETHLSLINCILPIKMTPMELRVMANFMSLNGSISTERFGSTARRLIRDTLKISPAGLSNYMGSLESKGFITKEDGRLNIYELLLPMGAEQVYLLKLINTGEE